MSRSLQTCQTCDCTNVSSNLWFYCSFGSFHYRLSLCVCIFGVVTNVLNFIVLTRKDLRTHINFILAALAISDFLVMVIYIPYSADYGFNMKSKYERLTFSYAFYVFIHALLSQTAHTVSIFLTIMLALWRYIAVCLPNKKNFVMKQTIPAIILSYIISPIISIPIYMSLNIKEFNVTLNYNESETSSEQNLTIYKVWPSELAEQHQMMYLWIYSVIIKLLPCIALTYLSLQLIHALYEAKKRKEKLTGNISIKLLRKKKQADRTTKMLIAVLLLFLVTEIPQGIMGLFSALLHKDFYHHCYQKMGKKKCCLYKQINYRAVCISSTGDFFDFLALINSSINFILYCTMSRQFRTTFANIFLPKCLKQRFSRTSDRLMEMDSRGQIETIQDTQMTQL